MADEKTPNRRYPLTSRDHAGVIDADNIAKGFTLIDADIAAILQKLKPEEILAFILGDADDIALGRDDVAPSADAVRAHVAEKVAALVNSAPELLDTLEELAAALGNDPHFATTVATQIGTKADKNTVDTALGQRYTKGEVDVLITAINTALSARALQADVDKRIAVTAQTFTPAQQLQARKNVGLYASPAFRPQNLIVNGNLIHLDEDSYNNPMSGGGHVASGNWYFGTDTGASIGNPNCTCQVIIKQTPRGSTNRVRITNNSPMAILPANAYGSISQQIEGFRIAHAGLGTAAARKLVFRFGLNSQHAGNVSVFLRGTAPYYRSCTYIVPIAAADIGKDVYYTVAIDPDLAGLGNTYFDKGTGVGLTVGLCFGIGTGYAHPNTSVWSTLNAMGAAGTTNHLQWTGAILETFDWGLYLDEEGLGTAPDFFPPEIATELVTCQRYYQTVRIQERNEVQMWTNHRTFTFPSSMRAAPSINIVANTWSSEGTGAFGCMEITGNYFVYKVDAANTNAMTGRMWSCWLTADARL